MKRLLALFLAVLLAASLPPAAEAFEDGYFSSFSEANPAPSSREMPRIRLVCRADYVVVPVRLVSGAKTLRARTAELAAAVQDIRTRAGDRFELLDATGAPLGTLNYDASGKSGEMTACFLNLAVPLCGAKNATDAECDLADFAAALKPVGKTDLWVNPSTLLLKSPESRRGELLKAVSDDVETLRQIFGREAAIRFNGLDKPVSVRRCGSDSVMLWIDSSYSVVFLPDASRTGAGAD